MDAPTVTLKCDMAKDCPAEVAMIDRNGFVYCEPHGMARRNWKPCRKLRPHELNRLKRGQQIARY